MRTEKALLLLKNQGEYMDKMMIGSRIKELRNERGMTQEQLAKSVGISSQAISKWENNIALPDITLVPILAQIFGVTIDDLFAYNRKEIQNDIEQYVQRMWEIWETNPEEGRKILEEGLQKYPENEVLLNKLLYVINYSANPDETIRIANKLIDKSSDIEVRYDALRFLAYAYNAKRDTESALAVLEQIPDISFTKLSEMAFVLSGAPKYEAADKQKWISFETLLQMMQKISEYYEEIEEKDKAVAEIERALSLISVFQNEDKFDYFSNYVEFFNKRLRKLTTL